MPAPPIIRELVDRYTRNRAAYHAPDYNETQLRREFLDPLFEALGWDVLNRQGFAEPFKDVIHEETLRIAGGHTAPDYSFRIGGRRILFLEAKRPAINLKSDVASAYQLRRYAWSAKLPLSILSNFAEFAVYDGRLRPAKTHKASVARVLYLSYGDYEAQWDKLASIFSKEAVLKGEFDRFAGSTKSKRGTAEVDKEFLREIEGWRNVLASNIALRNPEISSRDLNYAVQATIDRIVFLRICEDRGIERYAQLRSLLNGDAVYRRMRQLFDRADERYNSGLFHFSAEKDRSDPPDDLTPRLTIDDAPLKAILQTLYYPDSPYEFSVIPAGILGQVYEQFLGKVIRLTAGHQAKVEEKPEVKKAGGVFYTPAYVVDYIVRHTVGGLLTGKTPEQAAKLRIIDPACGSGSFLIGAYQYLLDWHLSWYVSHEPEKWAKRKDPPVFQSLSSKRNGGKTGPGWRLTTSCRKRVLLNSIYGVDIDAQAVEVTKLALLLKVLEDETSESLDNQLRMLRERALPDLGYNVKCGNSLIAPDYFNGTQLSLLDDEEIYRLNVFDWTKEFPRVFRGTDKGFDAVIGNPPYVRMETFVPIKEYLQRHYAVHSDRADLYAYFLEKGILLLNATGMLGMIVSNKFIRARYGRPLRSFLGQQASLDTLLDLGGANVFKGATVRTAIIIAHAPIRRKRHRVTFAPAPDAAVFKEIEEGNFTLDEYAVRASYGIAPSQFVPEEWLLIPEERVKLLTRLREGSVHLSQLLKAKAFFGLKTGLNKAFIIDAQQRKRLIAADRKSARILKPILAGRDVKRYAIPAASRFVIYCHYDEPIENYPPVREHLAPYRTLLKRRATKQPWYELQQPATALQKLIERAKIVFPIIAPECRFALDVDGNLINDKAFLLPTDDTALLAILNSRLANFYFASVCAALEGSRDRYLEFRAQYVDKFPIPTRLLKYPQRDKLASLAELMINLHRRRSDAKTPDAQTRLARRIETVDRQIDALVYELYGLTDQEIRIVEGPSQGASLE